MLERFAALRQRLGALIAGKAIEQAKGEPVRPAAPSKPAAKTVALDTMLATIERTSRALEGRKTSWRAAGLQVCASDVKLGPDFGYAVGDPDTPDYWGAYPDTPNLTLGQTIQPYMDRRPIYRNWNETYIAITDGFKASHTVFACVKRLMQDLASVPWVMEQRSSAGKWTRLKGGHPALDLLEQPNEFFTRERLFQLMIANLCLVGNSFWSKVRAGFGPTDRVVELWPIDLDGVRPVPDRENFLSHYQYYYASVGPFRIDPWNAVHMMHVDPANPWWGMAPLRAIARVVDTQVDALNWNKVSLQNRAVTDGVFSFEDRHLTRERYDDLRKIIRDQHQGSTNGRMPWVLGHGAKWQPMSLSPVEMDFINSLKMYSSDICCAFGVPPPLIGLLDQVKYDSIDTVRRIYWEDTNVPFLTDIRAALNLGLIRRDFGPQFRLNYDVSGVGPLQQQFGEKVKIAKDLFSIGYPVNVCNERLGLGMPAVEGGDQGYLPMTLAPADDVADGQTIPKAPTIVAHTPVTSVPKEGADMVTPDGKRRYKALHSRPQKAVNLRTKVARAEHLAQHAKLIQRAEDAAQKVFAGVFRKEAKTVVAAVRDGTDVDAAVDQHKDDWKKAIKQVWQTNLTDFGSGIAAALGGTTAKATKQRRRLRKDDVWEFDPYDDAVQDAVDDWVGDKIVQVTQFTKARVAYTVGQGQDEGLGMPEIASNVEALYDGFDQVRSMTIARTEVQGSSNFGQRSAAKQSGLVEKKTWSGAMDDRERESHVDIEGETQPLDEPYSNGCMFPGDPEADASETVNCRCSELYDTGDSESADEEDED